MNEDNDGSGGGFDILTDEELNQVTEEVEAQLFEAYEILDYPYRRRAILDMIAAARKMGQA